MPSRAAARIPADQPVIANLGMGVDSSAFITRWLLEPHTRNFSLDQLTVLIASVGRQEGAQDAAHRTTTRAPQ